MLDEIISGIAGCAIAKIVSKWAPARTRSEFAGMPSETLRRRNSWLYRGLLLVAAFGFIAPYLISTSLKVGDGAWFAGAIFGLPFSAMIAYVIAVMCVLGEKRARELLFYFETHQKMNIYVFYVLAAPLSLLGIVSLLFLLRD